MNGRLLPFFAWVCALTWLCRNDPFFWDTVQLGSKHAHFFFENGLRWAVLPPEIDSGHPPVFGWFLAAVWQVFGKNLAVSHVAMLPFLLGIVWLLARIGQRLGGTTWQFWLPAFALLDPVLAGQMTLVSPDIPLCFFFLLAVEARFSDKNWLLAGAVLGLCLISMRGMLAAAGLLGWFCTAILQNRGTGNAAYRTAILQNRGTWRAFLPGFLAAAAFLFWHWKMTGWLGNSPDSPWSPAFERVDFQGFAKNLAVVGWRWLDFGRVFEWAIFAWLVWSRKDAKTQSFDCHAFASSRLCVTRLFAWTTICLLPTALLFQNLSAHRYFLPAFLAFHLLVFQALAQANFSKIKKNCLLAALCLGLGTGNLWHYPTGVATGWDATLASLPYHDLRRQAIAYLSAQNIDFQTVGTAFPNINRIEDTDLNDDPRSFAPADFAQNRYILWSNIFNDFEKADLERLEREWRLVKKWERAGVSLRLFQRADEPSNLR